MANNRYSSSIDEILENLQKEENARPSHNQAVDDILADLGRDIVPPKRPLPARSAAEEVVIKPKTAQQPRRSNMKRQQKSAQPEQNEVQLRVEGPAQENTEHTGEADGSIRFDEAAPHGAKRAEHRPEPEVRHKKEKPAAPAPYKEERKAPSYPLEQPRQPEAKDAQPDIQAPSLSSTIQFDQEFQKFFSESIAVIPDEEPEQHPGFFARFMRKHRDEPDDFYEDDDEDEVYIPEQEGAEQTLAIPAQDPGEPDGLQDGEIAVSSETGAIDLFPQEEPEEPTQKVGFAARFAQSLRKKQEEPEPEEPTLQAEPVQQWEEPDTQIHIEMEEPTAQVDLTLPEEAAEEETAEQEPETFGAQLELDEDEPEEQQLWEENEQEERPRFRFPKLFGSKEPDEPEEEQQPLSIEDEEFDSPENAAEVESYLGKQRLGFGLGAAVSLILGLAMLYLELAVGTSPLPPIPALDPGLSTAAWLAVQLILLLVVCAVNWKVFAKGLPGICKTPTPDTIPAIASIGAAVQLVYCLITAESFEPEAITLFAAPAALLLAFNALGRRMMGGVVLRSFQLACAGTEHTACAPVKDRELAERITRNMNEPEPSLLANRPTGHIKGFLKRSFSLRASDATAQKLSWVLLGVAFINCFVCLFGGKGAAISLAAFAGTLVLGAPVAATLLSAVPALLMQRSASRVGAVIPGWSSVAQLSGSNMVVVGAKDLFPASCVRLHGIKTFEKQRIDLAILYAASILVEGCDTLRDVFLQIIEGRTQILYPVENLENHPGLGFTAWVDNNRMIVGNREFMNEQGVEIPSLDYEQRYTKGKREPVYLAVSGRVFAMFLVSYRANVQVADTLDTLRRQGISVLLHSDDFCLNSKLAARVYDIPESCIKVLTQEERKALEPFTGYEPEAEGCMSHMGTFASFVGGLTAAAGAASGEKAASLVEMAGVGVSCLLSLILAFNGGIAQLSPVAVLLYAAAWGVLTLAMPLFRNY